MRDKYILGWVQACFSVFVLWGLNNVMIGYSAQVLQANFLVYTCCAFLSCSFILLFIGGPGKLAKETMRSIDTWLFGLIMLLGYLLTLSLFSYVSSTEGSLLQRISLLFGVFFSWLFLGRKASVFQILGIGFVFGGILIICQNLPSENKGIIYLLMILEGLALTARMFVAEIHRPHAQAVKEPDSYKTRARVIGVVMFIMSLFFLALSLSLALLEHYAPLSVDIGLLPNLHDFVHGPSIWAGLFAGVLLVAPLRIIEFSSANTIKTENFLALAAFSSFSTYFWEFVLSPLTGMTVKTFSTLELFAMVFITIGSIVAVLGKISRNKRDQVMYKHIVKETQNFESVSDSREILAATLSHYNGDIKKAGDVLGIPTAIVRKMFEDDEQEYAFKNLEQVMRLYRKNVVGQDALTGLMTKSCFFQEGERVIADEGGAYVLIYLDLNKFKPVNDTYGHEAGDTVLAVVGKRLQKLLKAKEIAARLGGDEFCLLISDRANVAAFLERLEYEMNEPIEIQKGVNVVVGASYGVATYVGNEQTLKDLISVADKEMYKQKKSRKK